MKKGSTAQLEQLSAIVAELDKRQVRIKRAVSDFKKTGSDDSCAKYRWLKVNRELIESEGISVPVTAASELEEQCRDAMLRFDADLREAIMSAGYSLTGQWPNYYVQELIPVVVEEDNVSITVGGDRVATFKTDAVIASLNSQLKKLAVSKEAQTSFLRDMFDAYRRLTAGKQASVSVWDLYREIVVAKQPRSLWRDASAKNYRPFTEAEFRAHLTALLKANETTIDSQQLRLLPPISKNESVFIYQPPEKRFAHVGRIEFIAIAKG